MEGAYIIIDERQKTVLCDVCHQMVDLPKMVIGGTAICSDCFGKILNFALTNAEFNGDMLKPLRKNIRDIIGKTAKQFSENLAQELGLQITDAIYEQLDLNFAAKK